MPPAVFAQGVSLGASRPAGEWYGTLQLGTVSSSDGDSSWSAEGTLGRYILPNVALEGSVGYYSVDYSYGEVTNWPLSLSVRAGVPVQRFYPYVLGGVDLQFVDAEIGGSSDSDTAFGYHLGAGVEFAVSGNVYLGVEYRYTWIEAELFGVTQELDYGGTSFTVGVRF
jgi:opacity protein-like surface antigen